MKNYQFTAHIERDKETGLYVGIVNELPGAHSQAETLDELNSNLKEVIELCLESMTEDERANLPEHIGFQQFLIAA